MWRLLTSWSAIAIALAVIAAAADASKPSPHRMRGVHADVLADGARYALYVKHSGTLTVIDTQSKNSRDRQVDPDCHPASASAGRALLICGEMTGYPYPVVFNLRSGTTTRPSGSNSMDDYSNVGRHWIQGSYSIPHAIVGVFLNWRTGERVERDIRVQRNLDDKNLEPLAPCGRRHSGRVQFAPPFVLGWSRAQMLLTKCNSTKRVVISKCPTYCNSEQLSHEWVTWTDGPWVYAYSTRTGGRTKWRFRGYDPSTGSTPGVAHTRNALFVNVYGKGSTPGTFTTTPYQVALKQPAQHHSQ